MFRQISAHFAVHEFDIALMPGVRLPARSTAVRGADGTVALISPGPMNAEDLDSLARFGSVSDLIAPSQLHHLYFKKAAAALPSARKIAPRALLEKRKDLVFDEFLEDHPTLAGGLLAIAADGAPKAAEWLFFQADDRTLVVTDFMMNVHAARGWLTPLIMRMTGAWKQPAQTRVFRALVTDREAARRTARVLFELDIERIIMAHGEIIEHDGAAVLRSALGWLGVD